MIAFFMGFLMYIIHRLPEKLCFVSFEYNSILSNICGNYLADFIHPFSFILLTCAFIKYNCNSAILIAFGWLFFDILLEIGQKYSDIINPFIPECFEMIPFLNNLTGYFEHGTFDPFDLIAIISGAIIGFFTVLFTNNTNKET